MTANIPRILLAGTNSGCGKTTITCALLKALVNRKLNTISFKCGPDYIDPMFHSSITGSVCGNLDSFFLDENTLKYLLAEDSEGSDISIIEGVMGYYDGVELRSFKASTYEIAALTDTPVILVVGARGASLSVLATIDGFLNFNKDADSNIRGVILNQCTQMTYKILADEMIRRFDGRIKPLGFMPVMPDCSLESRHLGLITAAEVTDLNERLQRLAEQAERSLDIDGMISLARGAADLVFELPEALYGISQFNETDEGCVNTQGASQLRRAVNLGVQPLFENACADCFLTVSAPSRHACEPAMTSGTGITKVHGAMSGISQFNETDEGCVNTQGENQLRRAVNLGVQPLFENACELATTSGVRIAVARDRAFCFYYEDSLRLLEKMGAELVAFSPLNDSHLPADIKGLYLGGGYPELYAEKLSQNITMLEDIRAALSDKLPCIAECGGFMYLTEKIADHPMVGFLKGSCYDTGKLSRFGYINITAEHDGLLCKHGQSIAAHEFHHWDCDNTGDSFKAVKLSGKTWKAAVMTDSLYAGYPHFHFYANPEFARNFYNACCRYNAAFPLEMK